MPRIIPRIETGLPARVTNIDHITSRPILQLNRGLIVCHYTGAKVKYAMHTVAQVMAVIRSINRWRANEYNYVIDQRGNVYEFAGEYRAAHAKGYNDTGYGVLFLNGVGEPMTDAQLASFHYLFGCLLWAGRVQQRPMVVGHREIAATACPDLIFQRIHEMREYSPEWHQRAA